MMQDEVLKVIVLVCEGALLHMLVTILKGRHICPYATHVGSLTRAHDCL